MSIQDGNPVNAAYTNTKLASKEDDNTLGGKQALEHNNIESGANIIDLQKTVNDLITIIAAIGTGNTVTNIGGAVGELFKEKVGLDLRFRTIAGTQNVSVVINGDVLELGHPVEFLATDPVTPTANQLWFNANDKVWRFYDGLVITEIGGDHVDVTTNQTVGGEKTFTDKAYFSDEIEVTGKLTALSGADIGGTLTWVNTTNLEVTDNNITINKNGTDATAEGAGFDVERVSANGCFQFDSTLDSKWKLGLAGNCNEIQTVIKGTDAVIQGLGTYSTSTRYYATDTDKHYLYKAVADELLEIGSGGGGVGSPSIYGVLNAEDEDNTGFTNININSTNPIAGTRDYSIVGFPANFSDITIQPRNRNKENSVRFHYSLSSGSFKALVKDESANVLNELIISETGTGKPASIEYPVGTETTVTLHFEDVASALGVFIDDVVFDDDPFVYKELIDVSELRLAGSSTIGTGAESRTVIFDNTNLNNGGGFSVDSTNGTIVTILRDGLLTASASIYESSTSREAFGISHNVADASIPNPPADETIGTVIIGNAVGSTLIGCVAGSREVKAGDKIRVFKETAPDALSYTNTLTLTLESPSVHVVSTVKTGETVTKILSASVSTQSDISDLTFTGLEVGARYKISGHVGLDTGAGGSPFVDFRSAASGGGDVYGRAIISIGSGMAVMYGVNIEFTASSDTLFAYKGTTQGVVAGTGLRSNTFLQLTKINPTFLAAIPKNYFQQKSFTGGSMTFNNLVIGKIYKVEGSAQLDQVGLQPSIITGTLAITGATTENLQWTYNDNHVGQEQVGDCITVSKTFKATASTLTINAGGTSVTLNPSSNMRLIELNYTEETTRFN